MAFTRFTASSLTTGVAKYIDADAGRTPIPSVPTIGTATDLGTGSTVSVAFTPGYYAGTYYTATSSPGSITATSNTSPITVSGLTSGTAYTFTVTATNGTGTSAASAASNSVTPVNPTSFESIATFSGGGSSISFTSIPSTYASLQIRVMAQDDSTSVGNLILQLNSDTGTNYTRHYITADGSSVSAAGGTGQTSILASQIYGNTPASSIFGTVIWDIHNYASTTQNKTIRSFGGYDANGSGNIRLTSGLWINTAAITSIQLKNTSGGNFSANSKFALYGIKGA